MPNLDRQRLNECFQAQCKYFDFHCKVYLGKDCKFIDGDKIPHMRDARSLMSSSESPYSHTFKPYFLGGGA